MSLPTRADGSQCAAWILQMSHRGAFGSGTLGLSSLAQLQQVKLTGFAVLRRQGQPHGVLLYLLGAVVGSVWGTVRGSAVQQALREAAAQGQEVTVEARRATRTAVTAAQAILSGTRLHELHDPSAEQWQQFERETAQGLTGVVGRLEGGELKEVLVYVEGRAAEPLRTRAGTFVAYQAGTPEPALEDFGTPFAALETFAAPATEAAQPVQTDEAGMWEALERVFVTELGSAGQVAAQRFREELSLLSPAEQQVRMRERIELLLGHDAVLSFLNKLKV